MSTTQPNILTLRGTRAWREWLQAYARHYRTTPAKLIDLVLAERARADSYPEPPPRMGAAEP